jgi:phage shock protein PspC (stress-responsive transcriptional regulator)
MATIPHEEHKRLMRSRTDRILGGVCAGLARCFGTDPLLIRLVFVVITLAQGMIPVSRPARLTETFREVEKSLGLQAIPQGR